MISKNCLFCKIVKGEIKSLFGVIAEMYSPDFMPNLAGPEAKYGNGINPIADVHILIVPKKHIDSTAAVSRGDGEDIVELFKVATDLAALKKLDAYRLSFNAGQFQHVPHLHMHLLSGGKIQWSKL